MLAVLCALALTALLLTLPGVFVARAASPASGTIAPTGPVAPFTGTWTGTATGTGSANGEGTCVEGVNCDTFRLTVAPGDYTGKLIAVKIKWTVAANDYDLYIHKCPTTSSTNAQCNSTTVVGQSADGAPQTEENAAIDPGGVTAAPTDYTIHAVYFATSGPTDQYQGSATISSKTATRTANYISGGVTFSPSVTVKDPAAARDGEPSNRTDKFGNFYVGAIRGVPAGNDLWYVDLRPTVNGAPNASYDPYMRNPQYRGQPDSVTGSNNTAAGAEGGGDIDLAVGMPDPTTGALTEPSTLASVSLLLADISSQRSTDRGVTFVRNPAGNVTGGVPVDDRQWIEFLGTNTVYLLYRTVAPTVTQIQRSTDGGLTYGPAQTAGAIGQVGYIDVHQKSGRVYVSGSMGQVCHSTVTLPTGEAAVYVCKQAATDANGVAHIFFPVKVADDGTPFGTAYVAYSNDHDIFLVHSSDGGDTWSTPVRVSNGAETKTSVFPWLETGPTPGSVGIAWYGTSNAANNDNANWHVFFAQSFNANSSTPTFRQVQVSDHFIHGSNISEGGLTGTANRNLIDYFQISFDPTGAAVIAYADDHNDFDGHTYITRQTSGPAITGDGRSSVPNPGAPPPAQTGPSPTPTGVIAGSQVTDFRQDVTDALLAVIPADDPLDILSIKYSCETGVSSEPVIVATMKVSNLSTIPPGSNWRMNFTANAPNTGLSPTGDYSFALSDRGDQFFVRATTDPSGSPTFTYGTAVRNSDGSLSYTDRGAADCGSFDTANGTITVKVSVNKLNAITDTVNGQSVPFIKHGPPLAAGAVLAGLRGSTFTTGANGKRDITRGGTEFALSCSGTSACSQTPAPSLSINDVTVTEGNSGTTNATFTVTLSAASSSTVTVQYATADGTATAGSDYQAASGTLTFAPTETSKQINVQVNGDTTPEPDETFFVNLSNPTNATISRAQGTGTIRNDDQSSPPAISINDVTVTEGNSGTTNADFTVTLSATSASTVTVNFATADGTATAGSDYQAKSGTLSFAPNETSKTITVLVNGDTNVEPDETFFVNLSNPTNATIARAQGTGTIKNDDQPPPPPSVQLEATRYSLGEAGGRFDVKVIRGGDTSGAASVEYATSDSSGLNNCDKVTGSASQRCDYIIEAGVLRFAAGEASKNVQIFVIDDVYVEGNESFTFSLSAPQGVVLGAQSTATLTIIDNDSNPNAPNPIDGTDFFVRQHYLDFLNREPEPGGFQGWRNTLNNCPPSGKDANGNFCDRIEVSSDFYRSEEFQTRGYFIYRFYSASLGHLPQYTEFVHDMSQVTGFQSQSQLEASKTAFIADFMARTDFKSKYDGKTPREYVTELERTAGVTLSNREQLISDLEQGRKTRAEVLRAFIESPEVTVKFFNQAFVVMEYFGYLRRTPDALFTNWIDTLNRTNDYRIMVNGFVNSEEYRSRFGKP